MTTPAKATGGKATHPLPLSSTLHDLALLRASDLDLAALLPPGPPSSSANASSTAPTPGTETHADDAAVEQSVQKSLAFSREARAALKLLHTEAVDKEGARVDSLREKLEDVVEGLGRDTKAT
ncbi:hypothetical protein PYCCODRAFT_1198071 [Trametes coccinea BRFM310]|uniref:Uncharacterized protein n=1 Tax=Trametes coccinea (strain BRFM310) TaxID=1353009 RepID=A0A1Y2I7G0_TRAC3|nr:hypothetical protein PYCCODRAFT_1198071 [Trametes coccinea BRFM310]